MLSFEFLAPLLLLLPAALAAPTAEALKTYKIRGVTEPIYHLYLQADTDGTTPILGPEATGLEFNIGGSISTADGGKFLNIGESAASYKPVFFNATATTTGWGLEGDTIVTTNGSPWGRQLNFVACEAEAGTFQVWLQTGNDEPGSGCSRQTLHLPCLC